MTVMITVGLRELRQDASELVRRVENGEQIEIAATAHAHSARLYTRNPADLVGIEHLVEVVPV